jgi:hypothetical protein
MWEISKQICIGENKNILLTLLVEHLTPPLGW